MGTSKLTRVQQQIIAPQKSDTFPGSRRSAAVESDYQSSTVHLQAQLQIPSVPQRVSSKMLTLDFVGHDSWFNAAATVCETRYIMCFQQLPFRCSFQTGSTAGISMIIASS